MDNEYVWNKRKKHSICVGCYNNTDTMLKIQLKKIISVGTFFKLINE